MSAVQPLGLNLLSQISAAGDGGARTRALLFAANTPSPLIKKCVYDHCGLTLVGEILQPLPDIPDKFKLYDSRISKIALSLINRARKEFDRILSEYEPSRIGVVIGSSTSGIGAAEDAFLEKNSSITSELPDWYRYEQQEIGCVSSFIANYLGISGPCYTVSTACSSGAKAFSSARVLIESGFCDAVIAGGIDSLCRLTVGGFSSLELISKELSNPFSKNRSGLNIGEGGALFLVSKNTDANFLLRGIGEASDAYHISTPHPQGCGAISSITSALRDCDASLEDVSYMNLHGTGTLHNDLMEAYAVNQVLGDKIPCSSTKPITGHTLGAAGAIELAFCCLAIEAKSLPLHRFDNQKDSELSAVALALEPGYFDSSKIVLSNSFAFGGSNCCLAISAP